MTSKCLPLQKGWMEYVSVMLVEHCHKVIIKNKPNFKIKLRFSYDFGPNSLIL